MDQGDRTRLNRVKKGWDTSIPGLWGWRSVYLNRDWSKENIPGVQDKKQRFLGCWERKCNKYKQNYPSYKGELLALIQCIKKWKHILSYRHFEVHTDASALKYLTTIKNQSGLFTRWYQEIPGFNFKVIHKKGK